MRFHLSIPHRPALLPALALALVLAPPARSGTVLVDPVQRTVQTSKFAITFDQVIPDMILALVYKDLSPIQNLTAYYGEAGEFWGQSTRNTSGAGFIQMRSLTETSWTLTGTSAERAEITTTSQSTGQPLVTTRYRFFADQPYFLVDRTIGFAATPDTGAYQAYLPRMAFFSPYHAVRWRDVNGAVQQRGFCAIPCLESGWNGRWVEQMAYVGAYGVAVTSYFPATMPAGTALVDGWGPNTTTGWLAPLVPAGPHAADVTWSQMVGFSIAPDRYAALDSMWAVYTGGGFIAGVVPAGVAPARLAVAPNPARGPATIAWTSTSPGAHALEVLDVGGRRVARLAAGGSAPGWHTATWDGRDDRGAAAPPGLYFVRLTGPDGTRLARLARAN